MAELTGGARAVFTNLYGDLRFAFRGLRARPGFALTILITLALGVGANAAIFSVVDAVLLRPLPFAQSDRLVHLWERFQSKVDTRSEASYPDYLDWRARNRVFAEMGGYQGAAIVFGGSQPSMIAAAKATANFFDVLGVHAALGRTFAPGEDAVGAPRVALVSYGFWQRQLGGNPRVVGQRISLDGAPATVVGVLPADFQFAREAGAEIWTPIDRSLEARAQRGNHWLNIVARLKPGATFAQASQDMSAIMRDLAREYPESNAGRDAQVVPLRQELVGSVRPILLLLYGAVVVVLLIACVNVANLLLIRGTDRQREIAVRAALGAGKARLVRQFLTESLVLAFFGGMSGLAVAKGAVAALANVLRTPQMRGMPSLAPVGLDAAVIAYTLGVALLAGALFGLVPALRITRPTSYDVLRGAARGVVGGGSRIRDALVVGEVALTVVLLSGALLFGRSVLRLLAIDPGFRVEHVISAMVVLPSRNYPDFASQGAAFRRLVGELRGEPGVIDAGAVSKLPLDYGNSLSFDVVGQAAPEPGKEPSASYRAADAGYFRTIAIPVVEGRAFDAADDANGRSHVVINRALAKAYFGGSDPVGQRVFVFGDTMTVIGVVGDVPIGGIDEKIPPTLYASIAEAPQTSMGLVIRTQAVADASHAFRAAAAAVDPSAAVTHVMPMADLIARSPSVFLRRLPLYLVGTFAITALLLAIVGIYGVVSYSVAQRTRELGIRVALGAEPSALIGLVIRHGGWMAGLGVVAGSAVAMMAGRFVSSMLYGVRPTDPTTYALVGVVLAGVTAIATALPARRATRVDPVVALRQE